MDLTHVWEKILFAPVLTKPIDTLKQVMLLLSVQCCQFTQNQKKLILGNVVVSCSKSIWPSKYLNKEFLLNYIKTYLNI